MSIRNDERAAIKRVLTLVDGFLSTLPGDTLAAWDGGVMTWNELRRHVKAASKLGILKPLRKRRPS